MIGQLSSLGELVSDQAMPPFVYCYPPRSAYVAAEKPFSLPRLWDADLRHSGYDLNLYIHIPFCGYRCGFCNLYTLSGVATDDMSSYVDGICSQLLMSSEIIQSRNLRTIYIGGGTPTVLPPADIRKIFKTLSRIYPAWPSVVEEVAIEASPDSLAKDSGALAAALRDMGITRINLGVQSLDHNELIEAGRRRANGKAVHEACAAVRRAQIPNLSTDLIIGFASQTDRSWESSVEQLLALGPDTISTYFLTVRPDARFGRSERYGYARSPNPYLRYEVGRQRILAAGFVQETNVRYKIPGVGGYRQKALQFRGIPVLGVGAGARSYTNTNDYIIGGHHRPNVSQIRSYLQSIAEGSTPISAGFAFDDEERVRKRLALDLFDLRLDEIGNSEPIITNCGLQGVLDEGVLLGLLKKMGPRAYQITSEGFKYRDILSWAFFSPKVRQRNENFYASIEHDERRPIRLRRGTLASV